MLKIDLVFKGRRADEGLIDFYDAARALAGFQRSLALTTHLVLNNEIITQAPSAEGFQILIPPFEQGSWKATAIVAFTTAVAITSAGRDSPLGQAVTSVYDAALMNTMGFHVDYSKTIQQQIYEHSHDRGLTSEKIDSLCEKIENSVADMHRPIVVSETAGRAEVIQCGPSPKKLGPDFTAISYEYVRQTIRNENDFISQGYVASYNVNTYKGRIFSLDERRLIPF